MRTRQIFRREGDRWTIAFDGKIVRLPDARGLHYLAALLRQPDLPIHARVLVAWADPSTGGIPAPDVLLADVPPGEAERARVTVTKGIKAAIEKLAAVHPDLARHLAVTVRRGALCTYSPDPRAPIEWCV